MNNHAQSIEIVADIPPKVLPWVIWGLSAVFCLYEFFLHISPTTMSSELSHEFSVATTELGNLTSFYFYAFALMQIPVGLILDYFGARRVLTFAAIICALGCFGFGTASMLHTAEISRIFIGLGGAFTLIGCLKLAADWFPSNRFTFLAGIMIMLGMLGTFGGHSPMVNLVNQFGWRECIVILGILGGFLSLFIWFIIRDKPYINPNTNRIEERHAPRKFIRQTFSVLSNRQTWLAALYSSLMFAPTSAFGVFWGIPFLMSRYDLSRSNAGEIIAMLFIGWAMGSPFAGWISDRIQKRLPPMLVGSTVALLSLIFILYVKMPLILLAASLFCFGLFASGFLPAYAIVKESNKPQGSGTAISIISMLSILASIGIQFFVGYLLMYFSAPEQLLAGEISQFTTTHYQLALSIMPLSIILALTLLPFIKETHCRQLQTAA